MNFTIDPTTIIFIILLVAILILTGLVIQLQQKLKKFLIGNKAENLQESITSVDSSLKELGTFKGELESYLLTVEQRLKKSVQAVHTIRFNPFQGTTGSGGNQSFATALLNEHGDGVVISSLYAREHVSIFAKPIVKGKSEYELSAEEKQAVEEALKMVK
jgi:hypothetical protein